MYHGLKIFVDISSLQIYLWVQRYTEQNLSTVQMLELSKSHLFRDGPHRYAKQNKQGTDTGSHPVSIYIQNLLRDQPNLRCSMSERRHRSHS